MNIIESVTGHLNLGNINNSNIIIDGINVNNSNNYNISEEGEEEEDDEEEGEEEEDDNDDENEEDDDDDDEEEEEEEDDDEEEEEEGNENNNENNNQNNDDDDNNEEENEVSEEFNIKKDKFILNLNEFQYKHIKKYSLIKEKKCPICLLKYKGSDIIKEFPCNHIYHKKCILKWLKKSNICPLCKYDITSDINDIVLKKENDDDNNNEEEEEDEEKEEA